MATSIGKPINVSLRVIADLSQGLYRSPADALKELVSNAYDADSPTVEITFSRDFSTLTIRDKGSGMTTEQFVKVMETIGGSSKRSADSEDQDKTASGRKIVGRIGIGLLSVSQIANKLEVQSTTANSTKGFNGHIEFDQFASAEARKIKITDLWEKDKKIELGKYFITVTNDVNKKEHFTTLKLSGIKRIIRDKLLKESETDGQSRMMGIKFDSVENLVEWMELNEITKTALHEYDRLFWELCILCPVPYLVKPFDIKFKIEKSSITKEVSEFVSIANDETHLKLIFDGIECKRPIKMPGRKEKNYDRFFNLLFMNGLNNRTIKYFDYDSNNQSIEKRLTVKGYIYYQRPKVWPPELQGLIIRVRNIAVGGYDSTFLTYRHHEAIKFAQITGEIYVDGLDESLNIDRSSFRETEPGFVAFRDAIHNYLNRVVFPGIQEYSSRLRNDRAESLFILEKERLESNFKGIDESKRKLIFSGKQDKLVERTTKEIKIATTVKNKKLKFNKEFFRIVAFIEARLSDKLSDKQRDALYEELTNWLNEFDHG